MSTSNQIVSKLWSYCNILRDDGLSYPDYVERLTYLIFLKMASEQPVSGAPSSDSEGVRLVEPHEQAWKGVARTLLDRA